MDLDDSFSSRYRSTRAWVALSESECKQLVPTFYKETYYCCSNNESMNECISLFCRKNGIISGSPLETIHDIIFNLIPRFFDTNKELGLVMFFMFLLINLDEPKCSHGLCQILGVMMSFFKHPPLSSHNPIKILLKELHRTLMDIP